MLQFLKQKLRNNRRIPSTLGIGAGDIRLKYMGIFDNVFNKLNFELVLSFFQRFAAPDIILRKIFCNYNSNTQAEVFGFPSYYYIKGLSNVALYYSVLMQFLPDQVCCHDNITLEEDINRFSHADMAENVYYEEGDVDENIELDDENLSTKKRNIKNIKRIKLAERQEINTSLVVRGTRMYSVKLGTLIKELFMKIKNLNSDSTTLLK